MFTEFDDIPLKAESELTGFDELDGPKLAQALIQACEQKDQALYCAIGRLNDCRAYLEHFVPTLPRPKDCAEVSGLVEKIASTIELLRSEARRSVR